jgi:hypothetical protein
VSGLRQDLAWIGHAGASRLTNDTDGLAFLQLTAKDGFYFFFRLVYGMPSIVIDDHLFPPRFQIPAGAAFILDKEDLA